MFAGKKTPRSDTLVASCRCEVVERGPNWLFVKVTLADDPCGVAERLWEIARRQFVYRLVVEFDADARAEAPFAAELGMQLAWLCDRLTERGGALRLCGLSPDAARAVVGESGHPRLRNHSSPREAVWCGRCPDHDDSDATVVSADAEETWVTPGRLPRLAK